MGKHSGNGMGPAFQVIRFNRSGAAMQRDVDRRHRRDPETIAAVRELERAAKLDGRMRALVDRAKATGAHPLNILRALADEIREADRRDRALKAAEQGK